MQVRPDIELDGALCLPLSQIPLPAAPRATPITLFDNVVLAVRADDARIYLSLRGLCEALGIAVNPQRRRILLDEALHLVQFRVQSGGQFRSIDFLLLDDVSVWPLGIQQRRVSEQSRERFSYVKSYLVTAAQRAFAKPTGLPDGPSNTVEDLAELDRIDRAFAQLAELSRRQELLGQSQERARGAYRDLRSILAELRDRMQALERHLEVIPSPSQRGMILPRGAAVGNGARCA